MNKALILGVSSWIGHYLVKSFQKLSPETKITGTYRTDKPDYEFPVIRMENHEINEIIKLVKEFAPDCIFNLNRGEDDRGFNLHKAIINYCRSNSKYYAYFSSFNACDAQLEKSHLESELANSQSDYGKFKAKCESKLLKSDIGYCIFRFSATHGWAPNRISRTEEFLKKLKSGEQITIKRGIIQNRTYTAQLTDMMVSVAKMRGQGVFHLGTTDCSDELDFLRSMGKMFGYSEEQIQEGETVRCNAFMVPQKVFELCGDHLKYTERETLELISQSYELKKYRKG